MQSVYPDISMIFPLLTLALTLAAQIDPPAALADRLTQAEKQRDHPVIVQSLTQLTDVLSNAPVSSIAHTIPPIVQATSDSDPHIRSLALLALTSLTSRTRPDGAPSNDAIYLLEPVLPALTQHLADPDPAVRQLTALFLGGFPATPSPAVIAPLLAALASPERPTSSDLAVVVALLTIGADSPARPQVAPVILGFLRRPDLPEALAARLLSAIANHPRHSPLLDASLLTFLEPSHPADIRATLIGVLPHLDLTQSDLQQTRSHLTEFVADPSEDATVKLAATEVLPCWHSPRMLDPCPSPSVHYRMIPPPAKPAITPPRYQSPLP